jgi:ABC-type dipeptide/oligopeptide/nickel transport system ATPase component
MAQRVCIALALIHNPILIVADEPTFGLDVTVQRQVLDLMADLASRRGFAQLLVTRDLGIVAQYCQRVFVMQAGRIIESGPTMDLFRQPRQPYTQQLIASVKTRR